MNETPKSLRLHIGIFGRRNVGKSSLLNAVARQRVAIVSDTPGTTTDLVEKPMEFAPLGPVVFIDTAGIDDIGALGRLRRELSIKALERTNLALLVAEAAVWGEFEERLANELQARKIPFVVVFNKADLAMPAPSALTLIEERGLPWVQVSAISGEGVAHLRESLISLAPAEWLDEPRLVGDLLSAGELAVLVVPLDLGAPKGRLIMPQVQAIRDILESRATCLVVKEGELEKTLERLHPPADLVVCDSQIVRQVAEIVPLEIPLTTFSILMARFKGDLVALTRGAAAIQRLRPGDAVLIAESCAHHPQEDDIGRVKIPRWLRAQVGGSLDITIAAGRDFPDDLTPYKLIIHCGGCMINRQQMLSRIARSAGQRTPMTNYGLAISCMQGVMPRVIEPFPEAYREWPRTAVRSSGEGG